MVPVCRLPPELLIHIINISLGSRFHELLKQSQRYSTVCYYWREVVNNSPLLWASLGSGAKRSLVQKALSRSTSTPLDIVYSDMKFYPQFIADIIPHLDRCRALDLKVCSIAQVSHFIPALAPRLERLSIKISGRAPQPEPVMDISPIILPNLRDLTVDGINVKLGALSGLHRLSIENVPETGLTMQDVMNLLCDNSDLRSLSLSGPLPSDSEGDLQGPLIRLPRLHTLSLGPLQNTEHHQGRFLSSIEVPNLCNFIAQPLNLSTTSLRPLLQQGLRVLQPFANLKGIIRITFRTRNDRNRFTFSQEYGMLYGANDDDTDGEPRGEEAEAEANDQQFAYYAGIVLSPHINTQLLDLIGEELIRHLPGVEVAMHFGDHTPWYHWQNCLDRLPQITQLHLRTSNFTLRLIVITYLSGRGQDGWPCPLLTTLNIYNPGSVQNFILRMVQARYARRSSRRQLDRPRPLETLVVQIRGQDREDKAWANIANILKADHRHESGSRNRLELRIIE